MIKIKSPLKIALVLVGALVFSTGALAKKVTICVKNNAQKTLASMFAVKIQPIKQPCNNKIYTNGSRLLMLGQHYKYTFKGVPAKKRNDYRLCGFATPMLVWVKAFNIQAEDNATYTLVSKLVGKKQKTVVFTLEKTPNSCY